MAASIGSVTFTYPLRWVDKSVPRVLGSDTVTRSGNVVMLRGENTSQGYLNAKLLFEWLPFASVQTLYSYWRSGNTYSADLEDTGGTVTVRFAAENGVANVKHETGKDVIVADWAGSDNDVFRGELNLIIIS